MTKSVTKNKATHSLSISVPETTVPISNEEETKIITKMNMDMPITPPSSITAESDRNQANDSNLEIPHFPLDMRCICHSKMRVFQCTAFIDRNNIWCSLCVKKIDPDQDHSLYFCSKNSRHPDGYYLCNDCAVTKRIRAQIQRGYELNCDLIRSCGETVQTGQDDDYHRGVKFPCQSPSCEICDGEYYSERNNLYFKPTPWACYGRRRMFQ